MRLLTLTKFQAASGTDPEIIIFSSIPIHHKELMCEGYSQVSGDNFLSDINSFTSKWLAETEGLLACEQL